MTEIMTYEDVTALLRMECIPNARRVIKRYSDMGKLPRFQLGPKIARFRREDVVKFVADLIAEQNRPAATPPAPASPSPQAIDASQRPG
jgi:hypothetical protein